MRCEATKMRPSAKTETSLMPAQFLRGNLAALFTAVVWALTYAATKSLYEHVSPIDVIVLRFSVALVCLTGIAIAAHEPLRLRSAGDALLFALAGLFGFTLYFLLQNTALGYTQAANVAILASLVPIFNVLVMRAFFRSTPLTKQFFAGSALAIAGSVCITVSTVGLPQASPFGDALTLASCLVFPLYNVCVTKLADRGYGVLATTVWAFFFGLLFTLPAVVMVSGGINKPRYATPINIMRAQKKPRVTWTAADLGCDGAKIGTLGSPSSTKKVFEPEKRNTDTRYLAGSPEDMARELADLLENEHLL